MDDGFTDFRIGVAGLGLIGGSLAKALKKAGFWVAGFDTAPGVADDALKQGAVDTADSEPSVLLNCNLIFVALYPAGIIQFVKEHAAHFQKGSVVVDCCGIKSMVCKELYRENFTGFTFIGGHPMAGTENSGFSASFAELFCGASFILTPQNADDPAIEALRGVLLKAGFGRIVVTTPQHHDRMIAFTSQLPHVLACSYVMSPCCPQHAGFSAGSFRDISRVAHINPELWSQLFIDNKDELCDEIDTMIGNMQAIRQAAAGGDKQELERLLEKAREIKDAC